MKWSENYRINTHDCDASGIVRASLVLRYMQETANMQMKNLGPTNEDLRRNKMAFLLSRINISLYHPLYAGDEITCTSWGCESRGVSFNRCYQIRRGDEVIAEAASVWGLVDTETHKLLKVDEITLGFGIDDPLELDVPRRVHIPRDINMTLVGERTVVYSDIDANLHMNNTNYPDMLCDFIPDMTGKRVISLSISFAKEAKLGEVLKVYLAEIDGQYYFRTIRKDGTTNIEAIMMLE
jgi:medium-chain acyl-[acyl-carrier-protein] hydrolase